MPTYEPILRGEPLVFDISLPKRSDPHAYVINPTLIAGDVKVSKDGGAFANITTLPTVTPAGGKNVIVSLSALEMTADRIVVQFSDQSEDEWSDIKATVVPEDADAGDCPTLDEIAALLTCCGITGANKIGATAIIIKKGDGYTAADGALRPFDFTKLPGEAWPDTLTGWTIKFRAEKDPNTTTTGDASIGPITGSIITATGDSQKVRIELAETYTAGLAVGTGSYNYDVYADKAPDKHLTLRSGPMSVKDEYSA